MNNPAYNDWVDIFDSDISKIWSQERNELQRSAMLLKALQKEFESMFVFAVFGGMNVMFICRSPK